jgi:bifunctional non-homologous end joining protein LigD
MPEMQWVVPALVAQIRFVEWTADGHLRHAAYLGLRRDKKARAVRREA